MAARKKHDKLKKKQRRIQAELSNLQPGHPTYTPSKRALENELQLIKAQLKSGRRTSTGTRSAAGKKRPPLPGGASFPSVQLPKPKKKAGYEDSIKSLGNLRNMTKKGLSYMQQADQLFDSLHGVGSHLHQSGVLPKILKGKMSDLSTSDWTAILMALLNSPLSGFLLGGGGNKDGEATEGANQEGDGS
ncbi:MAG TPA: hypothetical protein VFV52_09935 [Bacilli bacterium]|nr:hypothetical protein [Bacilli bacterium]